MSRNSVLEELLVRLAGVESALSAGYGCTFKVQKGRGIMVT